MSSVDVWMERNEVVQYYNRLRDDQATAQRIVDNIRENLENAGNTPMSGHTTSSKYRDLQRQANQKAATSNLVPANVTRLCDQYRGFLQLASGKLYVLVLRRKSNASRDLAIANMLLSDYTATHLELVGREVGSYQVHLNPQLRADHPTFWDFLGLACHSFMVEISPYAVDLQMHRKLFQHRHEVAEFEHMSPSDLVREIGKKDADTTLIIFALSESGQDFMKSMKDIEAIVNARPHYDAHKHPVDFRNLPENLLHSEPEQPEGFPDYRHAIEFVAQDYGTLLGLEHDRNPRSPAHSLARFEGTFSKRRQQIYGLY